MNPKFVLATALRESRGARGRLIFFAACLAVGVAAVTGVAALVGAIESTIRAQSRELLGADMSIVSRRTLPSELDAQIALLGGARRVDVREMASVVRAANAGTSGQKSAIAELKAVGAGYPFFGAVELDPPGPLANVLDERHVAAEPALLRTLGLATGDVLKIGDAEFTVAAQVLSEPGRLDASFTAGPRIFMSLEGLTRTGLEKFGSRIVHRVLVRVPETMPRPALTAWKHALESTLPGSEYLTIETSDEAQPTIRRSLERVERYLALSALLSLVLGGVGVAQIVRAWVGERTLSVAVLRAIGFRPREVLTLYAGHVALLAFVASCIGAILGSFLPFALPLIVPGLLPKGFELGWEPASMWRGLVLGVGVALCFAIPPLTAVWRVPPSRVLRAEAEPLPAPRSLSFIAFAVVALGVIAAAWLQTRSIVLALEFAGGVAVAAGVLALGARGLTWLARHTPRERLGPYLVHGIAALARPGAGTLGAVVALGLGVLVVTTTSVVQSRLSARLQNALPADAPSMFLIDVQPDQQEEVESLLTQHGARAVRSVPVVTARLSAVDDVPVAKLVEGRRDDDLDRPRWVLTREQRITWAQELPPDNRIIDGALWSDASHAEVSLERDFARDLGAKVGSKLTFDVQGVPIELLVSSIRTVEWETFAINFFLVAEPGALDKAPHALLTAARIDADAEPAFQDELARTMPNVTPIRVRAILEKVVDVLTRLSVGVRVLGSFTIIVGLAILAGVASSGAVRRARETALLKALGVRQRGVALLFAVEYGSLGLVAGAIGGVAATVLAYVVLETALDVGTSVPIWAAPIAAALTAVSAALCGLLASWRALAARPIESLRG